jgi:ABC-2 type transport system permease protein
MSAVSAVSAATAFEWTKIRTLRSSFWNLLLFLIITLGIALPTGYYVRITAKDTGASALDPVAAGFSGLRLGLIALVIFGVIIVSSEYSSGTIRSSLTAVPRRGVFYGAKLLAGGAVALVSSLVVVLTGFFVTQLALGDEFSVALSDDGVLRAMAGGVVYTTLLCLFAMGLATVLRSAAVTIGILLPLFFIVSTILTSIPGVKVVAQFLPDVAGGQVLYRDPQPDTVLTPLTGLGVLVLWTAAALIAGYLAVRRRDA